jgi:hypothetical protein
MSMAARTPLSVLLERRQSDAVVLAEACRLARAAESGLTLMVSSPLLVPGLVMLAGSDPDQLRREIEIEGRGMVRDLMDLCGEDLPYSVTSVEPPLWRACLRACAASGSETLVVSRRRRPTRALRRSRLELVVVGDGQRSISRAARSPDTSRR